MKLFIVLSVFISLAASQGSRNSLKNRQRTTTPAYEERSSFVDERDCGSSYGQDRTNIDPYACICQQNNLQRNGCEEKIEQILQSNTILKLCKDQPSYYFGNQQKCHYDAEFENTNDPNGKAMQFGLDLFRAANPQNPNENFVISPLSPQILLSQLIDGCAEEARIEMIRALKLNSGELRSLVDNLHQTANKDNAFNKLDIASVMYKSPNMILTQQFNAARKTNGMKMQEVNFNVTAQAVHQINEWVRTQTRGNIQEIVNEQNLTPDLVMLLLNAIYFKGTWQYKFNETLTNKRDKFDMNKDKSMPVHMMVQENKLRFGEITIDQYSEDDNGLRWVELPYEGDQLSMILILPKERFQLDESIAKLRGSHLQHIFKVIARDHNPVKINLKLPRFTIKDSVSLVEPLKKLGIKRIFEDESALSKMSKTAAKVGDVKQESFLSVDEQGTTATAVSKVTIIPLSLNPYEDMKFHCDQPFMLMVVDKTNQIPLFMAKIKSPTKTKIGSKQTH